MRLEARTVKLLRFDEREFQDIEQKTKNGAVNGHESFCLLFSNRTSV